MARTFTYSLVSDLHLDHPQNKIPYNLLESNVIVAGDTMNGLAGLKFLNKLRNKGFEVFACDGNHEHYSNVNQGRTREETTERFQKEFAPRHDVDETLTILLINGWYDVSSSVLWYNWMNDCRNIFGGDDLVGMHKVKLAAHDDSQFILDAVSAEPDRKFIIVTHTAPGVETLDPRFEGHVSNEYYFNPKMKEIIKIYGEQILIWNHGHTHARQNKIVDGVRVVCNPRGYPRENPAWTPLTISVEY